MRAASLNYRDQAAITGNYFQPVTEDTIPLSDGAGEVIAVGDGVASLKVGDKVAGTFSQPDPKGPRQRPPHGHGPAAGRHARRAGADARDRRDQTARRLFLRRRRLHALRRGHRLERPDGGRPAGAAWRLGAGAGHRGRVDLGPAAGQGGRVQGDRHHLARRQGAAAEGARGRRGDQLHDPRGLGPGGDAGHRRQGRRRGGRGRRSRHPATQLQFHRPRRQDRADRGDDPGDLEPPHPDDEGRQPARHLRRRPGPVRTAERGDQRHWRQAADRQGLPLRRRPRQPITTSTRATSWARW